MRVLRLLGGLQLDGSGPPLAGRAGQRKRLALLALLGAVPGRAMRRDKLVAMLWPEGNSEAARHQLASVVYDLRQALGEEAVLTAGDEVRLNPEAVQSDVAELEAALERGDAEAALGWYGGPFLDGVYLRGCPEFEHWVERERSRLAQRYADGLEASAQSREAAGDLRGAVDRWRQLAAHDPYNSRLALRLMQALEAAGDPGGAIQHARIHETLLLGELQADPHPDVVAFAARLRGNGHGTPVATLGGPAMRQAAPEADVVLAQAGTAAVTPARRHRRAALVVIGVLLVVGATTTGLLRARPARARPVAPIRSLAVLPLENLSRDPDQEYFADGMTDALITELARASSLRVVSRTSVLQYKRAAIPIRRIARNLGVDAIVEGTVLRDGGRVRVTAQLIQASGDRHLWSESYERELGNVLALQREIAREIVERVGARLTAAPARGIPTVDGEAYDAYLRGRFYLPYLNEADTREGIRWLERAIQLDPGFAAAHAALAQLYERVDFQFRPEEDWHRRAWVEANRALALDSALAEAYVARGTLLLTAKEGFRNREAARAFRRALELDPLDGPHQRLGHLYGHIGLLEEGLAELNQALSHDPTNPLVRFNIGQILEYAGQEDSALAIFRSLPAAAVRPGLEPSISLALMQAGRFTEARAFTEAALAADTADLSGLLTGQLATAYAAVGDASRAREAIRVAIAKGRNFSHFHHSAYAIGTAYTLLGEPELALRWLRTAAAEGYPCYPLFARDPNLARLRRNPQFVRFLVELRREWEGYKSEL